MAATKEYMIIGYTRMGEYKTKLVEKPLEYPIKEYCEPAAEDVEDIGTVEISGDTDMLDQCYISE